MCNKMIHQNLLVKMKTKDLNVRASLRVVHQSTLERRCVILQGFDTSVSAKLVY